jgi:tRNA(Arg) A34 adenosine deaminase TadA
MKTPPEIHLSYPRWVPRFVNWDRFYLSVDDRMKLVIDLARENVETGTGGPFGAAVFDVASGKVVSVGVNMVVTEHNAVLHAEIVAIMMACQRLSSHSLAGSGMPVFELTTSCEPCAMCLGAVLWSGAKRLVCGATREDVSLIGFEEGPVFPESYTYLEDRGVEIERSVMRAKAAEVLDLYIERGGEIYNGCNPFH